MNLETKTREIVKHFNFRFSKGLGQNFLINEEVLKNIVDSAGFDQNTCALEIGPGIGTLTSEMAKKCRKVVAIELDDSLLPVLNETLSNYQNVKVIQGDALKLDINDIIRDEGLQNVRLAANLPYYVTTPIISKLFEEKASIESIIVMIQKEVGDRITARPGTKDYGAFTLLCRYYSVPVKVCDVPPTSFIPEPKVDSVVVKMNVLSKPSVDVLDEKLFFNIIKQAFNMRRKTLWNALKPIGLGDEKLRAAFEAAGIDPSRRGETLSIEEFGLLSDKIKEI